MIGHRLAECDGWAFEKMGLGGHLTFIRGAIMRIPWPAGIVIFSVLSLLPLAALADVDENSVFFKARTPLSELDFELDKIATAWNRALMAQPDAEVLKKYPLIKRSGLVIELSYRSGALSEQKHDKVKATGWISNLGEFLAFSEENRKKLVQETVDLLKSQLFVALRDRIDKTTGAAALKWEEVTDYDFDLAVIINDVYSTDNNKLVRLLLPSNHGIGQAGYNDGQFIYSEPYFLKLKVRNGRAVTGDPAKWVIERREPR